jgi:hypothetical protein
MIRPLALILLTASCALAQSQPPTPGRPTEGAQQQQPSAQQQEQREVAPPTAQPTQITIQQTHQDESRAPDDYWATWIDAILGLLTLGVAALQWRVMNRQREISGRQNDIIEKQTDILEAQERHMRDGLQHTKTAADAAAKSADVSERTLVMTQRAFIHLDDIEVQGVANRQTGRVTEWRVRHKPKVTGQTGARRVTYLAGITDKFESIPNRPPVETSKVDVGPNVTISCPFMTVSSALLPQLQTEEFVRFMFCVMEYDDVFDGTPRRLMRAIHRIRVPATVSLVALTTDSPFYFENVETKGD